MLFFLRFATRLQPCKVGILPTQLQRIWILLQAKTRTPWDSFRTATPSPLQADKDEAPEDEFDRWQQDTHPNDGAVDDPFQYWSLRQEEYPCLSRMAIEILSVPPMPSEPERLFSVSGAMVAPKRTRLDASTIGVAMTLRSWFQAGLVKQSIMEATEVTLKDEEYDSALKVEGGGEEEVEASDDIVIIE